MPLKNYRIFAEAYSTLDAEPLIEALADDCVLESQKVLEPLEGKKAIEDYLRKKFEAFRNANKNISCSLERVGSGPVMGAVGSPCVIVRLGEEEGWFYGDED